MPIKRVTTAGTAVPLTAGGPLPIDHMCSRTTLEWLSTNTGNIYIGLPAPGVGSAVTSTSYDAVLNAANPSMTLGLGADACVDRSLVYLNAGTNNDGVAESPEMD